MTDHTGTEAAEPLGWLLEMRGVPAELDETMARVVAGVVEHERVGSLTLTLKVSLAGESVVVAPELKAKIPQAARPVTTFFADEAGQITRHNPRQNRLPLRDVPAPPTNIREVR